MAAVPPAPDPKGNVCGLIVTLNPDRGFPDRIAVLAGQVARLVVVDNGTEPVAAEMLAGATRELGADLLRNGRNLGIGVALNQGIDNAASHGMAWVLTLDQDTTPFPTMAPTLASAFEACPFRREVGVVGSAPADQPEERPGCDESTWTEQPIVITAGALYSISAVRAAGGFRGDLFVDYVDIECCLRLRRNGQRIIRSCVPTMRHEIGSPRVHSFLGRHDIATHHSAPRRYLITRNRVAVWREYRDGEPAYVRHDKRQFALELKRILLFEADRPRKLLAVVRGLIDGARGLSGPPR